jgi:adenosylhomocysteine nucleosidase
MIFVAAEGREFDGLIAHMTNVHKFAREIQFGRQGELGGRVDVLAANGPGVPLATRAVAATEQFRKGGALVSFGFCGALDPELRVGDVLVATEVIGEGVAQAPLECPRHATGKLLTIDRVASTPQEKSDLFRQSGASAVDMEASAVARKAREWEVPFYCIRVVTDSADEGFALDFNRMRDADGRFSRARIIAAACRRPGAIFPELLQLNKRCHNASKLLGDFVANSRF